MTTIVVPASPGDRATIASLLASAFATDPHIGGLLPAGDVERRLRTLFAAATTETFRTGGHAYAAIDADDGSWLGAALWEAPGAEIPLLTTLVGIPAYLHTFGGRFVDAARTDRSMHAHRPRVPHWYLKMIGTSPQARGRGAGATLLRHGLARADTDRIGCYLESSTPANLPFYRRYGFVDRGPIPAHGTEPAIGMWRPPTTTAP